MIKTNMRAIALALALCLGGGMSAVAQAVSQTNTILPAQTFTASAQTGAVITLGQSPSGNGGSNSVGNITVTGTALSTVTFAILGSSDGGNTFTALPINAIATPGTTATTQTTTTGGIYQVNLAGITQVEFQTSGTFTATSVNLTLTTSPTGIIARSSGGSGPGSGTVNSAAAFSPTYYPSTGTAVSGATPFNGLQEDSTTGPPAAASSSNVQNAIGFGVYVPVGGYSLGTTTGIVNVLAGSLNAGLGTPTQANLIDVPISFMPNITNTNTTPTLNVNGLGAITITKCGTTPVAANDLTTGAVALVIYNGTNYQLQNPQMAICQTATAGALAVGGTLSASLFSPTASSTNVTYGGTSGNSSSQTGSATYQGTPNSGTGQAGNTFLKAGANTGTGIQGFAQVQQSFTTASALAATFEVVSSTTTGDQVSATGLGGFPIGIAQTIGGTNTQLFVVTVGKTIVRFDGTPVIGDLVCAPLSGTGTAGLAHDNGAIACPNGQQLGTVTGQVSGTGSGATATVELGITSPISFAAIPNSTDATVASATTIAPTTPLAEISGTANISTITLPPGFTTGCFDILATGAWSTVTGGNVQASMTAVTNTMYRACYWTSLSKWTIK